MSQQPNIGRICILGGPSSGKTFVGKFLAKYGASVLDVQDAVNMIINTSPRISEEALRLFGSEVMENRIKISFRKVWWMVTMGTPEQKTFVEEEIFSRMRQEVKRFLFGGLGGSMRVVIMPYLCFSGIDHLFDEIWIIEVDPEIQKDRLIKQENISEFEAEERIRDVWVSDFTADQAKVTINNSGSRGDTEKQLITALNDAKKRCMLRLSHL
jgi:dephospho-CoA kinase